MRSYYLIVFAAGLLAVCNAVHATTRDAGFETARVQATAQLAVGPADLVQAKTS
jgi:hypothetical protein